MKKALLFLFLIYSIFSFSQGYGCKQDLFPIRHPQKKLFGYVNLLGDFAIIPFYDLARPFKEGIAVVGKHSQFGLIDCNGKRILPIEYEQIKDFVNGYAWVKKNGLWGFVDQQGVLILECKYQQVEDISRFDDLAWVQTNGKWGVFDKEKTEFVHVPRFDDYHQLSADISLVEIDGLKGMIQHQKAEMVLDIEYSSIDKFAPYLLAIKKNNKYGVVRDNGKLLLKAQYISIRNLGVGRFSAQKNDKLAIYDLSGHRRVPFVLDSVGVFVNNAAVVKVHDQYVYVNPTGRKLFRKYYKKAYPFNNRIAIVQDVDGYQLINRKGETVSTVFEEMIDFGDYVAGKKGTVWKIVLKDRPMLESLEFLNVYGGIASIIKVETDKGQLFYDAYQVNYYSSTIYDTIGVWENGFIKVKQNGHYGYLDSNITEIVKPQYEDMHKITKYGQTYFVGNNKGDKYLHNSKGVKLLTGGYGKINVAGNYFVVCQSSCGVVDKKNKVIVPLKYDNIEISDTVDSKYSSYFIGETKGKYCVLDKLGNQLVKSKYEKITYLGSGFHSLLLKGKYTIIDKKGTVVLTSLEDRLVRYDKVGLFIFEKDDKFGLMNKKGQIKAKAQYKEIQAFVGVYAVVKKDYYGLIGKSGKLKESCEYSQIKWGENGNYSLIKMSHKVILKRNE